MADFTKTVSNTLNVFGPAPSTKWGTGTPYTMTWGTSKWGEGTEDLVVLPGKFIGNSLAPTSEISSKDFFHLVDMGSLSPTSETVTETLSSGIWDYVFVSNTSDADDRSFASWTDDTSASTSWTDDTSPSTTWS